MMSPYHPSILENLGSEGLSLEVGPGCRKHKMSMMLMLCQSISLITKNFVVRSKEENS